MRRWRIIILGSALFLSGGAVTTIANHTTEAPTYAGCLNQSTGALEKIKKGYATLSPCVTGEIQVHLSGGDITSVFPTSGGGLSGGGEDGPIQLALNYPLTDGRWVNEGQIGSVTSPMIRNSTVGTLDIKDNDITSADIKNNEVASSDIADGTLAAADVADGSITSQKLEPSVAIASSGPAPLMLGQANTVATAFFNIDGTTNEYVQITGQASVSCACNPAESMSIIWFITDTSTGQSVGIQYTDSISGDGGVGGSTLTTPISQVVSLSPGAHSLALIIFPINSGTDNPSNPTLNGADIAAFSIGSAE